MKSIVRLVAAFCMLANLTFAQGTARVQIIHNSPTPTVDIYANGAKLLDNFAFRTATPYIDVPAGVTVNIGVGLGTSQSVADILVNFPVVLTAGRRYVVVANGIVGNASKPFNLAINDMGAETATSSTNVGIGFFHGSPDAPNVDILSGATKLFSNIAYGTFGSYLNVPANATYPIAVTPAGANSTVVGSYEANLSFWAGKTAVIFASGLLGSTNSNDKFEPWVALSNGATFPLKSVPTPNNPNDPKPREARLQVIHNSPTPTVDIYVNGNKLLDNFVFRTATPFISVPAGVDLNIGVAGATSASVRDTIANFRVKLDSGRTYIAIANGIVGSATKPFTIAVNSMGSETATSATNVGIGFFHGSPDAPNVDILSGTSKLFSNIAYNTFGNYLNVPANATYPITVTPAGANTTIVGNYEANLSFWAGKTGIIFASGLLGSTNPNDKFEPWVALSNGATFPLKALPIINNPIEPKPREARLQVIHNSPTPTVDIYVNGNRLLDNFAFRTATPYISVPAGVDLNLGVGLATSASVRDTLVNFKVKLDSGKTYVAIAYGVVGSTTAPFRIAVSDAGREKSDNANNVDINFFHGSPDAPTVDILAGGNVLFNDRSFGHFDTYKSVPANATYRLAVTPGNANSTIVAQYDANLSFWKGNTAIVMATGFLGGGTTPFEPWVVLSSGGTFPLKAVAGLQGETGNNTISGLSKKTNGFSVYPNPVADNIFVDFDLQNESNVQIQVLNTAGQVVINEQKGRMDKGFQQAQLDVKNLTAGMYILKLAENDAVSTKKFVVRR
jgi:Domain of unknown function (DUF4397)/Secretion system C-terminal sorting domain